MFVFKVNSHNLVGPLIWQFVQQAVIKSLFSFRINGSGGYVTTMFWMDIPCRSVTFGGDCPLMSMPLLKGKTGNLLSLKVSLTLVYWQNTEKISLLKAVIVTQVTSCFISYVLSPGDRYWVFSESILDSGFPKSLKEMGTGLPKDRIDAALYYTPTGQTFFFRANKLVILLVCVCVCHIPQRTCAVLYKLLSPRKIHLRHHDQKICYDNVDHIRSKRLKSITYPELQTRFSFKQTLRNFKAC